MIVKIQPSNANVNAAVEYNEKKMNGREGIRNHEDADLHGIEDGHVLATRNVTGGQTLLEAFEELRLKALMKNKNARYFKNIAFHMSINPSDTDRPLTEQQAVRLADDIMEELGYGMQPYRVYMHTDIERTHYHVVSCRIGPDGKKVNADFERIKLREALKKLSDKYGFTLVLNEEEQKKAEKQAAGPAAGAKDAPKPEQAKKGPAMPFSRENDEPVTTQMRNICEEVAEWHLTTFEQVQALMLRRFRMIVEIEDATDRLVLIGTDRDGNAITPPVTEEELGIAFGARLREKMLREKMRTRREQRERIDGLVKAAAQESDSFADFCTLLQRKGVITVLSWSADGKPFGITYLDRYTKCAWKGSETAVGMKWFDAVCAEKGWTPTKDKFQDVSERRNAMPSRRPDFRAGRNPVQGERGNGGRPAPRRSLPSLPAARARGGRAPANVNDRTHASTAQVGDGGKDRIWKDIEEERPAELVR